MGTAILSVVFRGWRGGIIAGSALSAAYVIGVRGNLNGPNPGTGSVIGNVVALLVFTIATRFIADRLRSTARRTDLATAETLRAQDARPVTEARRARLEARVRQYGLLRDTS